MDQLTQQFGSMSLQPTGQRGVTWVNQSRSGGPGQIRHYNKPSYTNQQRANRWQTGREFQNAIKSANRDRQWMNPQQRGFRGGKTRKNRRGTRRNTRRRR